MSATCDAVFLFPPAYGNRGALKGHLGVAYLRAALSQAGMLTTQYVNTWPGTVNAVASDIVGQKAPIVGFTAYGKLVTNTHL